MKFIFIALILSNSISAHSQAELEPFDSVKAELIVHIIKSLHRVSTSKEKSYLYLNLDLRANKLISDGMSYMPQTQDSFPTDNRSTDSYIQYKLLNSHSQVKVMHEPAMGKINRRNFLEDLQLESYQNDRTSASYLEILQPIDGWDIFEILQNNFWLNRFHKDTTVILRFFLYVPVIYIPNVFEPERGAHHYLYAYQLSAITGNMDFKLLNRTVLRTD